MKTNTNSKYLIAVLIDGDNASFERMEDIMGFVSRYGDAVIRRIYGDWTRKALSGWKETAGNMGSGWCRPPPMLQERTLRISRWS